LWYFVGAGYSLIPCISKASYMIKDTALSIHTVFGWNISEKKNAVSLNYKVITIRNVTNYVRLFLLFSTITASPISHLTWIGTLTKV
jgi:hypothetical protein